MISLNLRRLFLSLLCATFFLSSAGAAQAQLPWGTDFVGGVEQAHATGKPLLVYFYATWCPWSQKLDAEGFADPDVQRAASQFVLVRLDGDAPGNAELMARMGVRGYPDLTAFNVDHIAVLGRFTYQEPPYLCRRLNLILQENEAVRREPLPAYSPYNVGTLPMPSQTASAAPSAPSPISASEAANVARARVQLAAERAAEAKLPKQDGVYLLDDGGTQRIDAPVSAPPAAIRNPTVAPKPAPANIPAAKAPIKAVPVAAVTPAAKATVPASKPATPAKPVPAASSTASGTWSSQ